MEMNEEFLNFFAKIQKKKYFFGGEGGRGRVWGGGGGQGGCERRIEVFVKIKNFFFSLFFGGVGLGGWGSGWGVRVDLNREMKFL